MPAPTRPAHPSRPLLGSPLQTQLTRAHDRRPDRNAGIYIALSSAHVAQHYLPRQRPAFGTCTASICIALCSALATSVWCLETPRSDGVCFSFDLLTHDAGLFFRVAIILDILLTPCVLQVEYLNDAGAEKHREVGVLRVVVLRVWFFARLLVCLFPLSFGH